MGIVLLWILFGVFSGMIASGKNRSFAGWFFIGLLFGPFGLLVAFFPKVEEPSSEPHAYDKAGTTSDKSQKKEYNFIKMKGKLLSYDGATGAGIIMMENKEKLDFDVKMWDDPEAMPEIGMSGLNIYNKDGSLSIMSSSYEIEQYEKRAREAKRELNYNLKTKVVGVIYQNDDGSDRQSLIARLVKDGSELFLQKNEYKPGKIAVAVLAKEGDMKTQIGNISAELVDKILGVDKNVDMKVVVAQVTGGTLMKPNRGVNIEIRSSAKI